MTDSPAARLLITASRSALCLALAIVVAGNSRAAQAAEPESEPAEAPSVAPPGEGDAAPKSDASLERAMTAYDLGKQAYNSARYEDALGHFQTAASLYGSPDFQYNIALCHEKLENYDEAIRAFETYIRAKPGAEDRANVEDRIGRLRTQAEEARKRAEEDKTTVVAGPSASELLDEAEMRRRKQQAQAMFISGAVLTGVGGAVALGGGIAFGLLARSRSNSVDDIQTGGNPDNQTFADAEQLDDEGTRFELGQIVTVAAGATVGIVGVALLAVGIKRKKRYGAGKSASVVPRFDRRSAGLVLTGKF